MSVTEQAGATHIVSRSGPATVGGLMDLARQRGVIVRRVTVQGTTLDDVFLHFTGRQLRDEVAGSRQLRRQPSLQMTYQREEQAMMRSTGSSHSSSATCASSFATPR